MSQLIEAVVDQSGVMQIPKEILEELEFEPGSKLFFELSDNGEVKLRKSSVGAHLVNKGGVRVIRGIPSNEIHNALERDREERMETQLVRDSGILVADGQVDDDVAKNWLAILRDNYN